MSAAHVVWAVVKPDAASAAESGPLRPIKRAFTVDDTPATTSSRMTLVGFARPFRTNTVNGSPPTRSHIPLFRSVLKNATKVRQGGGKPSQFSTLNAVEASCCFGERFGTALRVQTQTGHQGHEKAGATDDDIADELRRLGLYPHKLSQPVTPPLRLLSAAYWVLTFVASSLLFSRIEPLSQFMGQRTVEV
ncbi:hypothetical protein K458DRAFT_408564 [Lentithecium fluviatile CBS 122367]|uniref:Uncharacterized protein n=1 Tax=Lentithecium fluviatile CBS 122367 TaxID=1168545 RepID=A0A6G1IKV1_9PLEO|nr:hypothetical protein K458DRAFT_408564 [Lentithecium fluviatile CBS 122367]